MARYAFLVAQVENVSLHDVTAYAYDGTIITLVSSQRVIDCHSDVVYLIEREWYQSLLELGIPDSRLAYKGYTGIGRNGREVSQLYTFETPSRRVMPFEG